MLVLLAIFLVALAFGLAGYLGAPYVPILGRDSAKLLGLANLKPGQTLIDLGSGDGRLLRDAARRGIRGIGYEINPFMVLISWVLCWRYRRLITIRWGNLWQVTLPPADAVYVFLMPQFMARLDQRLQSQIHRPTRVISYAFEIPGRHTVARNSNTFVYEYDRPA